MPTGGARWCFWIAAVLLGCVIVASLVMKSADGARQSEVKLDVRHIPHREPSEKEIEQRRQTRAFELKAQKAVADVECRARQFKRKVSDIVEHYSNALPLADAEACFRRSESGVDFLCSREGLCGFKCSVALAYKIAWDKCKGTRRTEEAIQPLVESNVVSHVSAAISAYERWIGEFRNDIITEERAFATDLALRGCEFKDELSVLSIEEAQSCRESMARSIRSHAQETAFTTVGAALDLAMSRGMYAVKSRAQKIAAKCLAGAAARAGASVAAGGTCAVADGPLPFGDFVGAAISIGGLAWTAYDVYDASKKIPCQMRSEMKGAITDIRTNLQKNVLERIRRDRMSCEKSADEKLEEFKRIVEGR